MSRKACKNIFALPNLSFNYNTNKSQIKKGLFYILLESGFESKRATSQAG
jgi:hypothetical protein